MTTNSTPSFRREEVVRTVGLLLAEGGITELRALDAVLQGDRRSGTASGYFDSPEKLADAVARIVSAKGVYVIPNAVNPDLLSRAANRIRLVGRADPTTSDHDIVRRRWLLIDLDAKRPAGIGSTAEEHEAAQKRAYTLREYLTSEGWPDPIIADSGNGWHLLFRIDLPSDDGGLVQRVLAALADKFDDSFVKVDTSVFNPSRIWKCYGTLAAKGDSTPTRPHRFSRLVSVPEALQQVPDALLLALAGTALATATPATSTTRLAVPRNFDLQEWITKHLPEATGPKDWKGAGSMWSIPTCPFNPDHLGASAFVGRLPGGAITAGCHHNSCKGWGWKDLRDLLEPGNGQCAEDTDADSDEAKAPAQAEQAVRLALELCQLAQTPKREPIAVVKGGANVAVWLNGSGGPLRDILASEYRRRHGRVMSATAFADALATLRGEAMNAETQSIHLRVAPFGDGVVLDLGTAKGSAVIVEPTGWRVVDRSPVVFQRTALTGELPTPVRGGRIEALRELLNVTDETWPILLGWMVAALIPDMPHPILMLGGQQGAGKSTAARFICGIFDPSDAPTRSQPRDPEAWAMSVANGWATVIDNISSIPAWWSDAMCKAVTGDGWVRRTLYTNGDVSVLSFRRVIALTSIDAGALRGDLGERLVLVDLEQIAPVSRRTERELEKAYQAARPAIMGALLDLLAGVLARLESIALPMLPRMADFARVLAAMDATIGTNSLSLYADQGKRIAADVLDADPVGEAIVAWARKQGDWSGSAKSLLNSIRPETAGREWPKSGRGLAAQLKRLTPALEVQSVQVTAPNRNDRTRTYRLRAIAQIAQSPEKPLLAPESGTPERAISTGITVNGPLNRPTEVVTDDAVEADSGRSGDLGDSAHTSNEVVTQGERLNAITGKDAFEKLRDSCDPTTILVHLSHGRTFGRDPSGG